MNAGMNALTELNALRKEAKLLGIEKPNTMKRDALKTAIAERRELNGYCEHNKRFCTTCNPELAEDPCDDEGDILSTEPPTLADAVAERAVTREAWLLSAIEALCPLLAQAGAKNLTERKFQVSVSFPSKSIRKRIGECWNTTACSRGEVHNILVSPTIDDGVRVLGVVAHELIHADDNGDSGHTGHFAQVARALGLTGKMTATTVGEDLVPVFEGILKELGDYPHVKLNLGTTKKQTTRQLLVMCPAEECLAEVLDEKTGKTDRLKVRMTKKWIELDIVPTCPCGTRMALVDDGEGE